MRLGEHQVFRRAPQNGVGVLLVFGHHEQPRARQAADQDVAHLGRGFAPRQPVYIDALQRQQLLQVGSFDSGWRGLGQRHGRARPGGHPHGENLHPLPAFRASSS